MCLLDRGPVRNLIQFQRFPEFPPLAHAYHQAAVIGLEELLEHEQCEELMLSEEPGAVAMGVSRQRLAGSRHRLPRQSQRRFGGLRAVRRP